LKIGIEATRANSKGRGIDRYTFNLIKTLSEIDKVNEYILFSNNGELKKELGLRDNFKIEKLNKRFRMIRRSGFSWIGKIYFRDLDLFHFPNSDIWHSKYCKTIVTIHDLAPLHFPDKFFVSEKFYNNYKKCLKYIRKNADYILTVSDYSKEDIANKLNFPTERIIRIYNGIDSKFHKIDNNNEILEFTKRKLSLPSKFILFVGGLDFRKNVETLIRSFKFVVEDANYINYKLIIVGKAPFKKDKFYPPLEIISKELSLDKNIIFLREINDEELVVLYNLATLFVFPSIFEGFGFPPLEAMACSCPVICSNRCSLPEVVGDAGILVDPNDDENLAAVVKQLIHSPQLRTELVRRGMDRVKLFSWENCARNTIAIYKQLANVN